MDLAPTAEQEELRKLAEALFADVSTETQVRALMDTEEGYDPAVWRQLSDLGLTGLAIPEEYGGAGMSLIEVGLVAEQAGAALLCAPYLSTVAMATSVLLSSEDAAAKARYLPAIASGELVAALAYLESSGRADLAEPTTTAQQVDGQWRLTGQKTYVIDGHTAALVLVVARTSAGSSLFAVSGDAPGLTRRGLDTVDQTRKQAELTLDGVPADLVGADGGAAAILEPALAAAAIVLAAEQVGGAQRALEQAVEYAKVRHQFGRSIGSFQAVKHMCADMLLDVEAGRAAAYFALWSVAEDPGDVVRLADVTKAYCSEAFLRVAGLNVQIHGGIGFTWEHPAHLYLKRARTGHELLGSPRQHRAQIARHLLST